MYYVFETQVLNTFNDFDYDVGDTLTHTFMVDRDNGVFNKERGWYTFEMKFLDGPLYKADAEPFLGGLEDMSFARDIPADPVFSTEATTQFFYSMDNMVLELYTNNPGNDGFLLSQNFDEYGDPVAYSINLDLIGFSVFSENPSQVPVPEPATMVLFSLGLAGLTGYRMRRRK